MDTQKLFPETLEYRDKLINHLELENVKIIESSFERKNISYKVNQVNDKNKALLKIIQNESSIVYCNTRKTAEIISRLLNKNGYSSDYFHGGVSLTLKKEKLLKWHSEEIKIIIATTKENKIAVNLCLCNFSFKKIHAPIDTKI